MVVTGSVFLHQRGFGRCGEACVDARGGVKESKFEVFLTGVISGFGPLFQLDSGSSDGRTCRCGQGSVCKQLAIVMSTYLNCETSSAGDAWMG